MSNSRSLAKLPAFLSPAGVLSPQAGGTGVTSLNATVNALNLTIGEDVQAWHSTLDAIVAIPGTTGLLKKTGTSTWTLDTSTYLTGITGSQVTTALGFTPYNSTNPSGYISGITSGNVTTALGFTPYNATNPSGYISGITSSNVTTALGYTPENSALKGSANGYASLDGSGLVPASQLPSYVDDVLEYANLAGFPATGATGKIYVALDTNKTYRWSGSAYVYITSGAVDSVAGKTGVVSLASSDVGLGNVENKSSATIRSEISSANVTGALGFTPYNSTNPSGYITTSALSGYLTSATAASTYQPVGAYLTGITSSQVTTALGFTPYNSSNPSGYITGITSANVTTALGFTPYSNANPSGYITSSALSGYLTTSTASSTYLPLTGGSVSGPITINGRTVYTTAAIYDNAASGNNIGILFGSDGILPANGAGAATDNSKGLGNTNYRFSTLWLGTEARAPIFYDSNNTNYYVDPAGLTSAVFAGSVGINITDPINTAWGTASNTKQLTIYGENYGVLSLRSSSGTTAHYTMGVGDGRFYAAYNNLGNHLLTFYGAYAGFNNITSPAYNIHVAGTGYATDDWRAPIFYDANNTGYYIDPASSSRANEIVMTTAQFSPSGVFLRQATTAGDRNLQIRGTAGGDVGIHAHSNTGGFGFQIYGDGGANYGFLNSLWGGWNLRKNIGGALYLNNESTYYYGSTETYMNRVYGVTDIRSPIFYDNDNTNYYLNAAGTSNLDRIAVVRSGQNVYTDADYGYGLVGAYSATRYQGVFAMGDSYKLPASGADTGSLYGLAWSHPNAGGIAGNLADHGLLLLQNGAFKGAWGGGSFRTPGDVRGTIFYDYDNTAFYLDPAGTSNLNVLDGPALNDSQLWLRTKGDGNHYLWNAADDWEEMVMYFGTGFRVTNSAGNGTLLYCYGSTNGNHVYTPTSFRAPIFYDSDNTGYYVDPASVSNLNVLQLTGALEQGNNYAHPNVEWAQAGGSTGEVIFYLPGTTGNYGMVHMVFDIYEYDSPRTATITIGGHNWYNSWYNTSCDVVGYTDKQVRVGVKDGRFVVVFGTTGSTWSYGQIRLRKIQNGSYYNNAMDLAGNWSATQTTSESFSYISGDLRALRTPGTLEVWGTIYSYTDVRSPIYYDQNNTGYYIDPASDSNSALRMRGGALFGPNSTWGAYLAVGTNGDTNTAYASVAATNGNLHMDAASGYDMHLNYYAGNTIWIGGGGGSVHTAKITNTTGAFYVPIFYDYSNTAYSVDPAGTTVLNALTVGGQPVTGGGGDSGPIFSAF
jgi:hypothetical protein